MQTTKLPIKQSNEILVKTHFAYFLFAFIFLGSTGLIALQKILSNNDLGWIVVFCFVAIIVVSPLLIVTHKIESTKSDFILSFRTGKRIVVSKSNLTSVDQTWIRFLTSGFASHVTGVMWIRNLKELNKFIKMHINK